MVFIAIGAIKAAKAAKREYDKDKKRSQIIAPLDNSRRNEFDNAPASASPEWWTSDQAPETEPQQPQVSHNSFGAWSRDQLIEHVAEQQARQEEYDVRFREQLSNSSASLGSSRVPSASHSPALAVAQTRPDTEQTHHSEESPKQVLPPTIAPPVLEQEAELLEAGVSHNDTSVPASKVLSSKPPRPKKQSTCVEGSYEALMKASSTDLQQTKQGGSRMGGSSSGNDSISQQRTASRSQNGPELTDGSFESALRDGTATARYPPKPTLSSADGSNQLSTSPTSAFPSSANPKHLTRRSSMPVQAMTIHAPDADDGGFSQNPEKHAVQGSAFAYTSTAKRTIGRPQGPSKGPHVGNPVLSKAKSAVERPNSVQAAQGSAFQREGLCTKTRRKPRDTSATTLGPRTVPVSRTAQQGNTSEVSNVNPPNRAGGGAAVGGSCMLAEGTMKKRRGRRPIHDN